MILLTRRILSSYGISSKISRTRVSFIARVVHLIKGVFGLCCVEEFRIGVRDSSDPRWEVGGLACCYGNWVEAVVDCSCRSEISFYFSSWARRNCVICEIRSVRGVSKRKKVRFNKGMDRKKWRACLRCLRFS